MVSGMRNHQVEDFDVQGSGNEPHRAVSALHLGEGIMKSSAGRSHGEKRNTVLPLSARRKTRSCVQYTVVREKPDSEETARRQNPAAAAATNYPVFLPRASLFQRS